MRRTKAVIENALEPIGGMAPTNGGRALIETLEPYIVHATIRGTMPLIFHAWNCEAVEEKAMAGKGTKAKKTDNVESYMPRNEDGVLCCPATYIGAALRDTARFFQDPRSPRKSLRDLMRAAVIVGPELIPMGGNPKQWDYLDKRRVTVQQSAITRCRPAFRAGWMLSFDIEGILPEYVSPQKLHEILAMCGRVNGLADIRPTYGRFQIVKFDIGTEAVVS